MKEAVKALPDELKLEGFLLPADIPNSLLVSCGFPSKLALSRKKRRIGECWHGGEANPQVFVSPLLDKPLNVLAILVHELLHVTLPPKAGHKGAFKRAMKEAGLEGKPTATNAGEKLTRRLNMLANTLGAYPHRALDATDLERKKQTTRLRLYLCQCEPDKEAGVTNKARVASNVWQGYCKACETDFELQESEGE